MPADQPVGGGREVVRAADGVSSPTGPSAEKHLSYVREGLLGVAEWEASTYVLNAEERADAQVLLDGLLRSPVEGLAFDD